MLRTVRIFIFLMKFKITICMVTFLFVFSACNAAASEGPGALPPTPYPDTPAPPALQAPIVEAPALVNFHFINELDGWGATQTQIVRTNDGGGNWYNVTPPGVTEAGYGIRFFVLDPNHIWVQIPDFDNYPNSGFLYRTANGGLEWTKFATPFSAGDIDFIDDQNGWILADLGVGAGSNAVAVYRTEDGGENWTLAFGNDVNQGRAEGSIPLGGLKTGLTPLNTQTAWVYGVTYAPATVYLYRTDDGGETWSAVSVPLPESAANAEVSIDQIEILTPNDAMMAMRMTDNESKLAIYISKDLGNSWLLTPTSIPKGGSADFLSATDAVVYNGEQFYVTRDAAQTWNTITPEIAFGDTFAFMDFVNTSSGWVLTMDPTTQHSTLYRTTDGGSSWFPVIP
jgi:photosystem II stability/assembly factor-like uncharacterized protein